MGADPIERSGAIREHFARRALLLRVRI